MPTEVSEVRFEFGANWTRFLSVVSEKHIEAAIEKLSSWLGDLHGKTFLDAGCGSGIHSLAAIRLGAARVVSFDYDLQSIGCSQEMKRRFAPDANWTIERGSALDESYLRSLGKFDTVYSWGVLHHTGHMWAAIDLITIPVSDLLFISIYNEQRVMSRVWHAVKRTYHGLPRPMRPAFAAVAIAPSELRNMIATKGPVGYVRYWRDYHHQRGMSRWHDIVDWIGGMPFEVASPHAIFAFYREHGFILERMFTCGSGLGCNEFLFRR
jgi:2-polyprenyl-6-hydroxyphenyl methylase/3-demethylubiquinone-9 3-methyltransferase